MTRATISAPSPHPLPPPPPISSGRPSHLPLRELLLILQVPGQMLPPLWSPPWPTRWSHEYPFASLSAQIILLLQYFSRACLWSFDQLVSFTSLLEHRAGQLFSGLPRPNSGSDTFSKSWTNGWIDFSTKRKCRYSPLPLLPEHFLSTDYVSSIPSTV